MSEKTLMELVETRQKLWIAMLDARIRRAEAAERLAEALMRTIHGGANQFAEWGLIDQYRAAREAVRRIEAGLSNDDNS